MPLPSFRLSVFDSVPTRKRYGCVYYILHGVRPRMKNFRRFNELRTSWGFSSSNRIYFLEGFGLLFLSFKLRVGLARCKLYQKNVLKIMWKILKFKAQLLSVHKRYWGLRVTCSYFRKIHQIILFRKTNLILIM